MKRGEICRTRQRVPERGHKPGYYVVVSRNFIAGCEDVSTVVCAPVYSEILGVHSEVVTGPEEGLTSQCAVRCEFLTLLFKRRLTHFSGSLTATKLSQLDDALRYALEIAD